MGQLKKLIYKKSILELYYKVLSLYFVFRLIKEGTTFWFERETFHFLETSAGSLLVYQLWMELILAITLWKVKKIGVYLLCLFASSEIIIFLGFGKDLELSKSALWGNLIIIVLLILMRFLDLKFDPAKKLIHQKKKPQKWQ